MKSRPTLGCWVPLLLLLVIALLPSVSSASGTHLNRSVLKNGCASCHRGHGIRGTSMLAQDKLDLCLSCHGGLKTGQEGEARTDVQSALNKRFRHPVFETIMYHSRDEILPERRASQERHVSCDDCHDVHRVSRQDPYGNVTGYSRARVVLKKVRSEYEVCYKCHADSENLPFDSPNLRLLFNTSNPSYHPVERPGRNADVPSLVSMLSVASTVRCTDCHGNNDPGGVRGPHGSEYDGMLRFFYQTEDGPESPFAYELCYQCHDRGNILGDKSFKAHSRHILYANVSCASCHDPHGSQLNPHLIEFNPEVLDQGAPTYMPGAGGRPKCFLSCHGVDHNDAFYAARGW